MPTRLPPRGISTWTWILNQRYLNLFRWSGPFPKQENFFQGRYLATRPRQCCSTFTSKQRTSHLIIYREKRSRDFSAPFIFVSLLTSCSHVCSTGYCLRHRFGKLMDLQVSSFDGLFDRLGARPIA